MERLSVDEAGLAPPEDEGPYKEPWQRHATRSARATAFAGLCVRALGVVYGDIGTSPLYVFSTLYTLRPPAGEADFVGGCSLVIWSLLLMVTLKYAVFILMADNRGEGGIFAIGSLLIGKDSRLPRWTKRVVAIVMMVGAGLLLGDGAFTPAVSVLGAVGGLSVAAPGLKQYVVLISVLILILLFLAQPFGTSRIGVAFGPIILLWFATMSVSGVWRIAQAPRILRAFNPYHGLAYAFGHGGSGFLSLGSVFLAITGLEALYADIGHFGAWPIRVGWIAVALPALVLQYLGQGALLLGDPSKVANPFYYTVPHWAYWPQLVLATLAAIVASQAIITGSFSLTSQATRLGFAPPVSVRHTSRKIQGQIYVPAVNFVLLLLTVAIVAGFGTDVEINNAYGFTVCTTMIFTTVLFALVVRFVWRRPLALSALFLLFLVPDGVYWAALLDKLPHGGWVAALIALAFTLLLLCWYHGERRLRAAMRRTYPGTPVADLASRIHKFEPPAGAPAALEAVRAADASAGGSAESNALAAVAPALPVAKSEQGALLAIDASGGGASVSAARVPGVWAFFQLGAVRRTPFAFEQLVARTRSLPEALVFVGVQYAHTPTVPEAERLRLEHAGNAVYVAQLRVGFAESHVPLLDLLARARLGERATEPRDVTLVLGQESAHMAPCALHAWAWRWPLVVYEHVKHTFPSAFPSCDFAERNTIVVGVRALL